MNSSTTLHLPQQYKRCRNEFANVSIDGQNKRKRRRCIKSVRFSHLDTVHIIPPCREIGQIEKESRWYTQAELTYSKNAARFISRVWKCWSATSSSNEYDCHKIKNLQQCSVLRTNMQKAFVSHYPMNELSDCAGRSSSTHHFQDVCELDYSPHGLEYQIHGTRFQIRRLVIQLTLLLQQNNGNSINMKENHRDITRLIVSQCHEWTMSLALLGGACHMPLYGSATDEIQVSRVKSHDRCAVTKHNFDLIKFPLPLKIARLVEHNKRQQVDFSKKCHV